MNKPTLRQPQDHQSRSPLCLLNMKLGHRGSYCHTLIQVPSISQPILKTQNQHRRCETTKILNCNDVLNVPCTSTIFTDSKSPQGGLLESVEIMAVQNTLFPFEKVDWSFYHLVLMVGLQGFTSTYQLNLSLARTIVGSSFSYFYNSLLHAVI